MALTIKQEKFCIEYAKSGNARQAYKAAGYQCKNDASVDASASQLLRNPKVKERLAELAEEIKNNSIADIQEMQEVLTTIIRQQMEEEVIVCDPVDGASMLKKKASLTYCLKMKRKLKHQPLKVQLKSMMKKRA